MVKVQLEQRKMMVERTRQLKAQNQEKKQEIKTDIDRLKALKQSEPQDRLRTLREQKANPRPHRQSSKDRGWER